MLKPQSIMQIPKHK